MIRGRSALESVIDRGIAHDGPTAWRRLRTMRETADGFEIARIDLQIRGPDRLYLDILRYKACLSGSRPQNSRYFGI